MTHPDAPLGPQPAEMFTERTGAVGFFDEDAGAGTVVDDVTGATWFLHCTRIADGSRTIEVGTPVRFAAVLGPTGPEAADVAPNGS